MRRELGLHTGRTGVFYVLKRVSTHRLYSEFEYHFVGIWEEVWDP